MARCPLNGTRASGSPSTPSARTSSPGQAEAEAARVAAEQEAAAQAAAASCRPGRGRRRRSCAAAAAAAPPPAVAPAPPVDKGKGKRARARTRLGRRAGGRRSTSSCKEGGARGLLPPSFRPPTLAEAGPSGARPRSPGNVPRPVRGEQPGELRHDVVGSLPQGDAGGVRRDARPVEARGGRAPAADRLGVPEHLRKQQHHPRIKRCPRLAGLGVPSLRGVCRRRPRTRQPARRRTRSSGP